MNGEMAIRSVRGRDTGSTLAISVELRNDSDRTLHAVREARRVTYDPIARVLDVGVVPGQPEPQTSSFVLPSFTSVDPHSSMTIEVALPRFLTRLNGATPQGAPIIERVPIHEATAVTVEVAWSDTPFYRDPRQTGMGTDRPIAEQLRNWQSGIAEGRGTLGSARRRKKS